ncbi:SURF1 family protein [Hoyosella rhizosphaerae]|uniref:SURF1-like protein n=1 Tax=Hoyosella rhizosphaerae TaxID=1755582 RepID=A0A916UGF1_9ACTN|nr:SURF1 family protein [Hoyosella rhizosphaerae]MBN4928001.1 SURF1 family protein [Hoyosella rhizosphaerae]GGC71614.1 SURF1-like protein [Hoyosella rhizosphaerae]
MRRFGFLLRPGWVALVVVVGVFAYLAFTVLAPWQLGKNAETERRNALIEQSVEATPVAVSDVLSENGELHPDMEWRRVTLRGEYLPESEVVVRLRSAESSPAFEVLTPFKVDDATTVLVNRGYVITERGTEVPQFNPAPTGVVELEGRVRVPEGTLGREAIVGDDGITQVYSINLTEISAITGLELPQTYVQLAPEQPGGLGVIGLPQLSSGPFLSYGLQWIAFGIMAPLGLLYFARAELRERRRNKAPKEDSSPSSSEAPPVSPPTAEDRLASRYGKRR